MVMWMGVSRILEMRYVNTNRMLIYNYLLIAYSIGPRVLEFLLKKDGQLGWSMIRLVHDVIVHE